MTKSTLTHHMRHMAIAATALVGAGLIAAVPASAQQTEQVTVTGSRMVKETIGRNSSTGMPLEQVRLSRDVSYIDLNLTKQADVETLHTRINEEAKNLCAELDQIFKPEKDRTCVSQAVDRAMRQANSAVAAAHK